MLPKVVILDFDGTLVESVAVKDAAFKELFADRPDKLDEIMRYHRAHDAVIRFEKFRHVVEDILGEPYTDEVAGLLVARFCGLVMAGQVSCPWVPGARELLESLIEAGIPLYLVSVNPPDDLASVLDARDLGDVFAGVYAHPTPKAEALGDILRREGVEPRDAVYVGDTREDREAARSAGVPFIGRAGDRDLGAIDAPAFRDLWGVADHLGVTHTAGQPGDAA